MRETFWVDYFFYCCRYQHLVIERMKIKQSRVCLEHQNHCTRAAGGVAEKSGALTKYFFFLRCYNIFCIFPKFDFIVNLTNFFHRCYFSKMKKGNTIFSLFYCDFTFWIIAYVCTILIINIIKMLDMRNSNLIEKINTFIVILI